MMIYVQLILQYYSIPVNNKRNVMTNIKSTCYKSIYKEKLSSYFLLANILLPTYSQIFCEWHLSFRLVKNFHVRETNQGKETEISKCIVH